MKQTAIDGTTYGDKGSPKIPPELEKAYVEYTQGDFLGDFTVHAVHNKDVQEFREIAMHDFANDDWRAFKFMVKLYKSQKHFIELFKYVKPEGKKNDRKDKPSVR